MEKVISLNEAGLRDEPAAEIHKPLGGTFEAKSYAELTDGWQERRDAAYDRVGELKEKVVSRLGGAYIKSAFQWGKKMGKLGKDAAVWSKAQIEQAVFSHDTLADYGAKAWRQKGEISKSLIQKGATATVEAGGALMERAKESATAKVKQVFESELFAKIGQPVAAEGLFNETVSKLTAIEDKGFQLVSDHEAAMNVMARQKAELEEELAAANELIELRQQLARRRAELAQLISA